MTLINRYCGLKVKCIVARNQALLYAALLKLYNCILQVSDAIENEKEVSKTYPIYNVDRAVCGRVAGAIAKKYGDTGFAGQLNITYVNYFLVCIILCPLTFIMRR